MNRTQAKSHLNTRVRSLTHEQFEQLCKMLLGRVEHTHELELTPRSNDGGIDVYAVVERDLYRSGLGVQAKHYSEQNNVSAPEIRNFRGALGQHDFTLGAFITTSDFTKPARKSAENSHIRLINHDQLLDIMTANEIGVTQTTTGTNPDFNPDESFWEAFDTPTEIGLVPSIEVPQADSFTTLDTALKAIKHHQDASKHDIVDYFETTTGEPFASRQGDYYGISGWVLGLVHKEQPTTEESRRIRKWGLTRIGEEYLEHRRNDNDTTADAILTTRIRDTELINRLLTFLDDNGTVERPALVQHVVEQTELNDTTANRRMKTLQNWLAFLPEVTVTTTTSPYTFTKTN